MGKYQAKFSALYEYAMKVITQEQERICFFISGLNSVQQVLSVMMTST